MENGKQKTETAFYGFALVTIGGWVVLEGIGPNGGQFAVQKTGHPTAIFTNRSDAERHARLEADSVEKFLYRLLNKNNQPLNVREMTAQQAAAENKQLANTGYKYVLEGR